jgi:Ca2+-binding RTX toxin-like protein
VFRLRSRRRLAGVALAFAAAVLALAVAAWADPLERLKHDSVIRGTNGSDVLRGTRRNDTLEGLDGADRLFGMGGADRIYGARGNDRVSGGPGADKLMGGPGGDVIRCGGGKDVVYADSADRVAKDCEVVHRIAVQPSTGLVTPGRYGGGGVGLQVQPDGRTIVDLSIAYDGECRPIGNSQITVNNSGPWAIQADRTFTIDDQGDAVRLTLHGSFAGDAASGTFDLRPTISAGGTSVECDTGPVAWRARRQ